MSSRAATLATGESLATLTASAALPLTVTGSRRCALGAGTLTFGPCSLPTPALLTCLTLTPAFAVAVSLAAFTPLTEAFAVAVALAFASL